MLVVFSNQSQPFKGKTASLQSSRQMWCKWSELCYFHSSVLEYKSCVQVFIYLQKTPKQFSCHPPSTRVPPESHQSPTFLALETRGLRILIVALSSIILHLVSALVIPLLAAWWSFGGEAKNPCGLGELDIADDLELIPEGCHKIGSDK